MKNILSLFLLFLPVLVNAEPASNIAWTPDAMKLPAASGRGIIYVSLFYRP